MLFAQHDIIRNGPASFGAPSPLFFNRRAMLVLAKAGKTEGDPGASNNRGDDARLYPPLEGEGKEGETLRINNPLLYPSSIPLTCARSQE